MPYVMPTEPPPRVAEWFRQKKIEPSFDSRDVWRDEHQVAFTVAKMTEVDLLQDMHEAMSRAIEEGTSLDEFVRTQSKRLQELGWWGRQDRIDPRIGHIRRVLLGSPAGLRLIYETNLRTSLAAGQWDRIEQTQETHPYLLYQLGPSKNHRPQHVGWHGTLLPADDPWWRSHFPPNGFGCKCWVRQVSQVETDRRKWKVSERPPERYVTREDPRTGLPVSMPEGIDPGWDVSHRRTQRAERLRQVLEDKRRR